MKLIWYNSLDECYEFGNPKEYRIRKSSTNNLQAITLLMEFSTQESSNLAHKILNELNIASKEQIQFAEYWGGIYFKLRNSTPEHLTGNTFEQKEEA